MKTSSIKLYIGEKGSNIRKTAVTPAEVMFLVIEHSANAGKCAVELEGEEGEVTRQPGLELMRLRALYSQKKLAKLFPPNSRLPETFAEALAAGTSFNGTLGSEPLVEMNLLG